MGEAESPKPESSFNISNEEDEAELGSGGVLDLGLVKSDPDKLYPIIYYALKRTLKEWEEAMDERPGKHSGFFTLAGIALTTFERGHKAYHSGKISRSYAGAIC